MGYSVPVDEKMACAYGRNLNISWKDANQVCANIKGMPLKKAREFLNRVLEHRDFIEYRKYNTGIGHRTGGKIGKYPEKAIKEILKLLRNAEANAEQKGLDTEKLYIYHATAYKGANLYVRTFRKMRPRPKGRGGPRKIELANIEIVVKEDAA